MDNHQHKRMRGKKVENFTVVSRMVSEIGEKKEKELLPEKNMKLFPKKLRRGRKKNF